LDKKKIVNLLSTWHIYVLRESEPAINKLTLKIALLYVFWNNSYPQPVMGFYLKSFNAKPAPVPGRHYSISQINQCEYSVLWGNLTCQCLFLNRRSSSSLDSSSPGCLMDLSGDVVGLSSTQAVFSV
jgi:hypothetical protein